MSFPFPTFYLHWHIMFLCSPTSQGTTNHILKSSHSFLKCVFHASKPLNTNALFLQQQTATKSTKLKLTIVFLVMPCLIWPHRMNTYLYSVCVAIFASLYQSGDQTWTWLRVSVSTSDCEFLQIRKTHHLPLLL